MISCLHFGLNEIGDLIINFIENRDQAGGEYCSIRLISKGNLKQLKFIFIRIIYARKQCVLYEGLRVFPGNKLVEVVEICNENTILNWKCFLPCTTHLILSNDFPSNPAHVSDILEHIMPIKQLRNLTIRNRHQIPIEKLLHLLNVMPNIQTLYLNCDFIEFYDRSSIEQREIFRNIANSNQISHLIINDRYRLEMMKLFIVLCPQIKQLTIEMFGRSEYEEDILELISEKQTILPKLCLLHLKNIYARMSRRLETFLNTSDVCRNYSYKCFGNEFYVCF